MGKSKTAVAKNDPFSSSSRDYEIKDAVRTLVRAEEIKRDKSLFGLVKKEISKQKSALETLSKRGK